MMQDERTAGLLLSRDGTTQIMVVELISANDLQPRAQMLLKQEISDRVRKGGLGANGVYLAGMIVSQGWMYQEVAQALRVLFPIGLVVICLTVYTLFHRLSVVVMTALIGLTAIIWAIAAASVVFGKLSVLVAAAPLVIMVISTSDVVHLATAYRNELANGLERIDALRKVMREVGGACLLTSVTTFVGFMSLMAIPAPSTRHLALAAAIGVAGALLLAITLVPIAFSFLPPLPVSRDERLLEVSNSLIQSFVGTCRYLSITYSWPIIVLCALLLVGSLASLTLMHVDIDYAKRFRQNHPLRNGMEFFNEKLAGSTNIEVFVNAPSGSVLDPKYLSAIARFEEEIKLIPEVTASHSISMLFRLTDQILKFRTHDGLPENQVMAESCVKVYRDIDRERLTSMLTSDARQTRISIQLRVTGFLAITDVAHRVDEIAQRIFPDSMKVQTSGSYPIIGKIVRKMVRSQMLGLATCFVSISVIMALGLRSVRCAMLAQFPNMLPAALIIGFLACTLDIVDVDMLGLPTVALGLAVDDTIHFLHRYQIEWAKSNDAVAALDKTFAFTGQAILQTTMILCIGLLPFALGSFLTIWMLGTYLVVTLLLAVLADLLLLPAMIKVGIIT
jgi:predicted RND superfamily exporter protein